MRLLNHSVVHWDSCERHKKCILSKSSLASDVCQKPFQTPQTVVSTGLVGLPRTHHIQSTTPCLLPSSVEMFDLVKMGLHVSVKTEKLFIPITVLKLLLKCVLMSAICNHIRKCKKKSM